MTEPTALEGSARDVAERIEAAYQRIGVTRAHVGIVAMVLLGVFFDAVEQNTVGIAGPVLRESWGLTAADIGLLNTATFTAVALGRLTAGYAMDRFGRRALLTVNLLMFSLGSLLCAIAPNHATLVAARFLVGLGLGGEVAVAVIMLAEFFSARQRGTAIGLINVAAAGLGNMLAPLFGIAVYAVTTGPDRWRWIFGLLVLPALAVVVYRRNLPETPWFLASRGRYTEADVVIARLQQGRLTGPVEPSERWLGPLERIARPATPLRVPWRVVFRGPYRRVTIAMGVAVCMSYAAQITMLTLVPVILTDRGIELTSALWYTLVMQSGSLVGALAAALIARRLRRRLVLTVGAALGVVAALGFGLLGTNVGFALAFGALFNFAVIVLNTTIWIFAPEQYPTAVRGVGTSVILAIGSLSAGLFPFVAGVVLDAGGVPVVFLVISALFAVCAVAARLLPETFGRPLPSTPVDR